ncbi:RNA polymerase sigma factor [Pedobacter mendelii]|uniref:DNA-directed RNA polymerase sigma-70 factor n=1 Tax=Pedobacter mendelii TaxID=1908240 RepID=A0ABQ2BJW3_9SPHI|nr:sigma-70 family RNA polymerase sigma factor [Pedobacter mendelii]GGI27665.1 DNA-directed RNA polymerase sigma-70 factor [Pedobacter mendelii]
MIPNRDNEHALENYINGCIRNEREGQQALYKHFYGFAMGICLRYANNRLDAAGILNDGFFKVFKNIEKYESDKPFKAWIGRIITNTAIDHYRANLKFADHTDISEHDEVANDQSVYAKLAYEDLLALVQKLSPAYRTVFNLFAIDGYSHEEISEMLSISVGTSKSNLFKARQKLQDMLKTPVTVYERKMVPVQSETMQVNFNTNTK